ncbi:hypothetical protein Sliba_08310 [Streptomyces nigrescens]|uniref:Uncharacterized protein n=1 Tax=Streptomyces nigrescens TaxID=1920 RepID=A0A640TAM1_STRNI|nr:hypothetical protein Sliba_08310 [Streptomyces libani subsp. libani]GGV86810.1 hypothetical protein GCM10010500_05750 [Streptomyces libani subsp. libani]
MEAVLASTVAVVGTLMGAWVTYSFQRRAVERADRLHTQERLRQEQLTAYSAFIGILMEYRKNLYFRWRLKEEEAPEEQRAQERAETYRLRSEAEHALARARLVTGDVVLMRLASRALSAPSSLRHAVDRADLVARRGEVERVHDEFVEAVARFIGRGDPVDATSGTRAD